MPHVNKQGRICHGKGSAGVFLDNVPFDTGGDAQWYNDNTIVYQHGSGNVESDWYLAFYDIVTHTITKVHDTPPGILYGSREGHWAAWKDGIGIYTSFGWTAPDSGLLGIGPDGMVAHRVGWTENVDDAEINGLNLRSLDGADVEISSGPAAQVCVTGGEAAVWQEKNLLMTHGLPAATTLTGGIFDPKAFNIAGEWWLAYFYAGGVVVHPFVNTIGYKPITGAATFDVIVLEDKPTTIRVAWSLTLGEEAGKVAFVDIDTATAVRTPLGVSATPVVGGTVGETGVRTLTVTGTFGVAGAAAELVQIPIEIFPAFPSESGFGRIVHPFLGAFDYEVKPDEWVNIDADAIIPPVWASSRTLTSAANVLWNGNIRDVVVEERWKSLGGLAMPITQLRMLIAIWTTPIDPDVGYVHWHPNYITGVSFKVLPVNLSVGGQGIAFDDVVNYKDEFGDPIGWVTAPVTLQLKLVERL